MSGEQDRLAELLRSAAADAERNAPAFDVDQIVATAHRRRPWLAFGAWLRSRPSPNRPAVAVAALVVVVAVAGVLFATLRSGGGGPQTAIGTTTTSLPQPSTTVGTTTTTGPPASTTTTAVTSTTTSTTVPYSYSVTWRGKLVSIEPAANVDMARIHDARLQGVATDFHTDNPADESLDGASIDVWTALAEFPAHLVVNNSEQSSEPKGTWTFAG